MNPQSHRAFQREGELLASSASSRTQLDVARPSLNAALRLNAEEMGTLMLLGEVDLGLGELAAAEKGFMHACQANTHSVSAWFLRGYIAWKRGDLRQTVAMLSAARAARAADWKPSGTALEGDVRRRMHSESGFLIVFAQEWDGSAEPERAYRKLDHYLHQLR